MRWASEVRPICEAMVRDSRSGRARIGYIRFVNLLETKKVVALLAEIQIEGGKIRWIQELLAVEDGWSSWNEF